MDEESATALHYPSFGSHFSDETRPHIKNLTDFFTLSKAAQESRLSYLRERPTLKLAAVLVLVFEQDQHLRVILTTRSKELRTHGGQTSLPGGKMDGDDASVIATALREANEEISLPISSPHIHVLGTLEPHPFHGLTVMPVVALLTDTSIIGQLKANKGEVDHIFSHPLEAILDPDLAPSLDSLVEHGTEYWPYESRYHYHKDHVVQVLGGLTYRLQCFQTSATPITGFTSDILIQVAGIAYDRPPQYERYAFDQLKTYDAQVEAFEANRDAVKIKSV